MNVLSRFHHVDTRLLLWSLEHRDRGIYRWTARGLSRSGDGYLQICIPSMAYMVGGQDARLFAWHCAIAFAIERVLYFGLKNSLRRRRPPECMPDFTSLITASDRFSFPSGHTSAAFLLAALVYAVAPVLGIALFIWAVCVACSRVALGVHFPSDTLAGATLGLSVSALPILPNIL